MISPGRHKVPVTKLISRTCFALNAFMIAVFFAIEVALPYALR